MRLTNVLILLPALAVLSVAQETNFSTGPNYLITSGSPMSLRSIATPSISLGEAQPFAANVSATEALAKSIPSTPPAPSNTFLSDVYWGEHKESVVVARWIDTPSMTPSQTAAYMNSVVNEVAGVPSTQPEENPESLPVVIQLTGGPPPSNLPASIFDAGVTGMTNAEALTARGYGVPLGDVAAYWKSHKRAAPHVFTNADVRPR